MTSITHNNYTEVNASFLKRALSAVKTLRQQRKREQEHQASYRKLAELPDYLLKDMGISRAELNLRMKKPDWWS